MEVSVKFRDLVVLCIACGVALFGAACGSDDQDATETANVAASTDSDEKFSAAVTAADPEEATACLEKEGFTVTAETSMPDDVVEAIGIDQVLALSGPMGAGSISYYESEEKALPAHKAELDNQVPDTVIGRTERAVYVFSGSDNSAATKAIEGCI
jgi:hypothetical protein